MTENILNLVRTYESAIQINAIAMTDFPEIGKVIDSLKMIKMPVSRVPFEIDAVKRALKLVLSHRAKGRIVIDMSK